MDSHNNYVIIDSTTETAVVEQLRTRKEARLKKRELEYAHRAANGFHPVPSRYYVETGSDNKNGAGIYLH